MPSNRAGKKLAPLSFKASHVFSFSQFDAITTALDRDCANLLHLVGHTIVVDGVEFSCIGARAPTRPPHRKGTEIVLQIVPVPQS